LITVWTACTGDAYNPDEVGILKRQVDRHLSEPHIFICITEHEIEGITTLKPKNMLPGWWIKVRLFSGEISHPRNLWLDLDSTITGSLDDLITPLGEGIHVRTAWNWAVNGHGSCQSSVMFWQGDSGRIINDLFDPKDAHWPPVRNKYWDNGQLKWGDQEWATYLRDTGKIKVEYFEPWHVISFKYHCKEGLPPESRVQCWHGKPDPADRMDIDWVREARA